VSQTPRKEDIHEVPNSKNEHKAVNKSGISPAMEMTTVHQEIEDMT
jgi:hypothetical protein